MAAFFFAILWAWASMGALFFAILQAWASAFTSTPTKSCFEVFLNHRGPDTKDKFALPLYKKLDGIHDIRVFLDKEELQVGKFIDSQIYEAIRAASVHVAIFSPKYAESRWCLDELHAMVESGKPIIPVFYDVEPGELKRTDGDYARALLSLEKKRKRDGQPRHNPSTVQNWRDALFTVAGISGLELKTFNGDEEKLLDEVVKSVLKKLDKTRFDVAEHPTGLDEKIEKFEEFLQHQSSKPLVIGIVGMGGIGKTTFVEEFFNRRSSRYNKSCIIRDVRENSRKNSLESLQDKLLSSLTKWRAVKIENVDLGRHMLRTHAKSCQALVILDDVDSANQLYALLSPIRDILGPESLILITSRDKAVLSKSRVQGSSIFELKGLNPQHSKELFCLNAFKLHHPLPGFEDLVDKYLKACNGLPLSLKVLGALVFENDRPLWEGHLKRIQQVIPEEIKSILQISYDTLQRDEKQMFLDIACFFIGKKKETTIRIWQGFGWEGSLAGFQSLQNKNLVQVDIKNEIRMHDCLRDLGRDLAKDPSLPRRICGREDIDLLQQSQGITAVRGISFGWRECEDLSFSGCKMKDLRLLDISSTEDFLESILNEVQSPNLIWLRWNNDSRTPMKKLPSWIPLEKLRVLEVSVGELETFWQEESQAPLQLRELKFQAWFDLLPDSFGIVNLLQHLNFLQHLDLSESLLEGLPDSFGNLINLHHLDLSRNMLEWLPDSFGNLINLHHLDLSRNKLEWLPDSFGNLINLHHLDLSRNERFLDSFENLEDLINLQSLDRHRIEGLPDSFGNLINLQHINLSKCSMLERLPDSFGNLINLQHLDLSQGERLKGLPDSFGNLINLQHLDLSQGERLEGLPDSFGNLINLQHLDLSQGKRLKGLPDSFGNLINLQHIDLSLSFNLKRLPDSFGNLINLQHINLSASYIPSCSFGNFRRLKYLHLSCSGLCMTSETLGSISTLEYLCLDRVNVEMGVDRVNVEMGVLPPQVAHQRSLKKLAIMNLTLTCLPSDIGELRNLQELMLHACYKLKCLPDSLRRLNQLTTLKIYLCNDLEELPSMETLVSLEVLRTTLCGKLRSIRGLARLTKLRGIQVMRCYELKELVGVEHVSSLEWLYMEECPNLQLGEGVDPKIIHTSMYTYECNAF